MSNGGTLDMVIGTTNQSWGEGANISGLQYGYGQVGTVVTSPGPTIIAKRTVAFKVNWHNHLGIKPHLLSLNVVPSLLDDTESACYNQEDTKCGVPVVVHVHGLENPPEFDGLPHATVFNNQTFTTIYRNSQQPSFKIYHDHALGLSRLNKWAGLVGAYIVQDPEIDAAFNLTDLPDYVLAIQDKLISSNCALLYPDEAACVSKKWLPESYGNVNTVNGVVMPFLQVEARQVRFRWANVANARVYSFDLTAFGDQCLVIATDGGYVHKPKPIPLTHGGQRLLQLYPLERVEMVCDFTSTPVGSVFNISNTHAIESSYPYDPRVLQIQIKATSTTTKNIIPQTLTEYKDLGDLFHQTNGLVRRIKLGQMNDPKECPTHFYMKQFGQELNISTIRHTMHCTLGKVEQWIFTNPSHTSHPFHWHLVNAQCGPTEDSIDANSLKDVVEIPSNAHGHPTQVCYVACMPNEALVKGSHRDPTDFGTEVTKDPYLAHCHIIEHQENAMMAWFRITRTDVVH
ncbi:unnamed protein product [Aphanomyces euteiches]